MKFRISVTLVNQGVRKELFKDYDKECIPRKGEQVHLPATYSSQVTQLDWLWCTQVDVIVTLKAVHLVCLDMVVKKFKERMWYEDEKS